MSQSHELQLHITKLEEIRSILNSMKNLALIEVHKLGRYQPLQSQSVSNIEEAGSDFLRFHPQLAICDADARSVYLLVGAERGFCGDFNEQIILYSKAQWPTEIISIGSRLNSKLTENDAEQSTVNAIAGANVSEEIPSIVNVIIDCIAPASIGLSHSGIRLTAIYHDSRSNQISQRQLIPPVFQQSAHSSRHTIPPVLNLQAEVFFSELISHYLFAVLHEILCLSLTAENYRRLQHLEAAVKHLDDETVNLRQKSQIYRQEEITEEIEVILLNSENT